MAEVSKVARQLKKLREEADLTVQAVSDSIGMRKSTYSSKEDKFKQPYFPVDFVKKLVPVFQKVGIAADRVWALAGIADELSVDIHKAARPQGMVAGSNQNSLALSRGNKRAGEQPTESVPVIGSVQAGAWMEAYQLPEEEWTAMSMPADVRYPGIKRFAWLNAGESMNKVCRDGGHWVGVMLGDLAGVGVKPQDYVLVERVRKDGLIEATVKKFELRGGKPWLCPESHDASFRAFPLAGGDDDEEIRVVALMTGAYNSL